MGNRFSLPMRLPLFPPKSFISVVLFVNLDWNECGKHYYIVTETTWKNIYVYPFLLGKSSTSN